MKKLLKIVFINFFTLLIIAKIIGAIEYSNDYLILFWSAFSLSLLNKIAKPLLNLLLMPINLITLGSFRWVVNILVLLIVMIVVGDFRVVGFSFPGFSFSGFSIPKINFSFFLSLILVSFLIEVIFGVISWIFE